MFHALAKRWLFVAVLGLHGLLSFTVRAGEISHQELGFVMEVPDSFRAVVEPQGLNPVLYQFVDREPSVGNPATVVGIERLGTLIRPGHRMDPGSLTSIQGMTVSMEASEWKGLNLDVMKQAMMLPKGGEFVVYTCQFPLANEAVQLQVGGSSQGDVDARSVFEQIVASFENTRPLPAESDPASHDHAHAVQEAGGSRQLAGPVAMSFPLKPILAAGGLVVGSAMILLLLLRGRNKTSASAPAQE